MAKNIDICLYLLMFVDSIFRINELHTSSENIMNPTNWNLTSNRLEAAPKDVENSFSEKHILWSHIHLRRHDVLPLTEDWLNRIAISQGKSANVSAEDWSC